MMRQSFFAGFVFFTLLSFSPLLAQVVSQKQNKLDFVDGLGSLIRSHYAPRVWKKDHLGIKLQDNLNALKQEILSNQNENQEASFQKGLTKLFNDLNDYHVGVTFYRTESATLPLTIRGSRGRYFIVDIDKTKLAESSALNLGDEVLSLGGRKISEILEQDILPFTRKGTRLTDMAVGELFLTTRMASLGLDVPKGPVRIKVTSPEGIQRSYQFIWAYTPEKFLNYRQNQIKGIEKSGGQDLKEALRSRNSEQVRRHLDPQLSPMLESMPHKFLNENFATNPYALGNFESHLPLLGKKLSSVKSRTFNNYIYEHQGKKYGLVRIPSYMGGDLQVREFKKIIEEFENKTDALVIDQLNNPGGSVFYLYALASYLSPSGLTTPRHRMIVTNKQVHDSFVLMDYLKNVKNLAHLRILFGATFGGHPVDYNFRYFVEDYAEKIVRTFHQGETLTQPMHVMGVDDINPAAGTVYTKPILVLINELDYSGGDFFPAILQDNKRAKIMGQRTAGAGGMVESFKLGPAFGIQGFTLTTSLAHRQNSSGDPLEDLGVTPDVPYELTPADYQNQFVDYVAAINQTISAMTE